MDLSFALSQRMTFSTMVSVNNKQIYNAGDIAITKKLEELFELASHDDNDLTIPLPNCTQEVTETALSNLEKIEAALPQVRGLEAADTELDELADLAKNSYKDLMDLGFQVESRFSSEIFNSASSMLGHAITSRTAKINKKLKQLDLMLKKAQLDQKLASKTEEVSNTPLGEGQSLDRNELLKILTGDNSTDK